MSEYEVPNDEQVVNALHGLGGPVTAMALCRALVASGHPIRQSQLAIQRAADRGRIQFNKDWTLSAAREVLAA